MLATMSLPPFLSRFVRSFTQTSRLSLAPDGPTSASIADFPTKPTNAQYCTLAAGCFWGTEHVFRHQLPKKEGITDVRVGYMGGDLSKPKYREVCGGKTGHAEVAQFQFNPEIVSYRELIEFFYRMHDPTTLNRQGPDTGPQYRSAIYYHDEEQERIASDVTKRANQLWWHGKIVTEVAPAGKWWDGEDYHQAYLDNNKGGYECPSHFKRPDNLCPPLY